MSISHKFYFSFYPILKYVCILHITYYLVAYAFIIFILLTASHLGMNHGYNVQATVKD